MLCQATSLLQESIQCCRPVVDSLAANYLWIDRIAKYAPKNRYEAGYRSHGIERRSVGLDEKRIRVNIQQNWQGKHVRGGLERSEEHTSELQSQSNLVCRLLLE